MTKRSVFFIAGFVLLIILVYNLHHFLLTQNSIELPFSLDKNYFFHGIFSVVLCVVLFSLSKSKRFKDQLGFLYLVSVALKIFVFCMVFYEHIFGASSFTKIESASLLVPLISFLFFEVFFISKVLNNLAVKKNE